MNIDTLGGLSAAGWTLAIIILVLWALLPFAVFGIKGRLDQNKREITREVRRVNAQLKHLIQLQARSQAASPKED